MSSEEIKIIIASVIFILSGTLLPALVILQRKRKPIVREIAAFSHLHRAVGRLVEDGSRLHVALGRGNLVSPQGASTMAGLSLLYNLAELTSSGDKPPIATSGEASLAILSQSTLQNAAESSRQAAYDPAAGILTGMTPFSYAAGSIPVIHDENISATVLIGNFGPEAALLTDAAERTDTFSLGGSDNLTAQALMYATAQETVTGEELFAAGAYHGTDPFHAASLTLQDILRWLVILVILGGGLLKMAGIL